MTGNYTRAGELLAEALRIQREQKASMAAAWSLQYLGMLAYLLADYTGAGQYFHQSITATQQGGSPYTVPSSLDGFAGIASALGHPVAAARLLGAAEALRETLEDKLPPLEQPYYDQIVATVRAQLADAPLREAWGGGRTLTHEQAIAEAEAFTHIILNDS
jgi:tetratricopeptide (TPR) repeat protein